MDNTALVDLSLVGVSLVGGWLAAPFLYKTRQVALKRLPLFLMLFAGLWCGTNWLAHLVAVLIVNGMVMLAGKFVYSFHFYSLLLMGIVFLLMSLYQLNMIKQVSRGKVAARKNLRLVSWLIIALSLPIFPLNPIGLLPVISSVIVLATVAAVRKQLATSVVPPQENIGAAVAA